MRKALRVLDSAALSALCAPVVACEWWQRWRERRALRTAWKRDFPQWDEELARSGIEAWSIIDAEGEGL